MISKPKVSLKCAMRTTLSHDFSKVQEVSNQAERFLLQHGCDEETRADLELALVEACNNAIKYTPRLGLSEPVIVELLVGRAEIELRVTDHGPGFCLPDKAELPKSEDENGRGLYLIRRVMDSVRYERGSGSNVLVLRRKRRRSHSRELGAPRADPP